MNKKTKNIVSVLQSMSAAVLCTLCTVLFLASCTDESLVDNPQAQNALRTVSVDLGMPQDKPAFGEGTTSRAADAEKPAEILLGDSTLAVSRTSSDTYYTTTSWANNDELLVKIEAGSTEARLTLKYTAPAQGATSGTWTLIKNNSYVKYTGTAFAPYSEVEPVFFTEDEDRNNDMSITGALTMRMDWTAGQPIVSIIYAPDMEWSLAQDNTVSMEQKNPATTATTAPELWTVGTNGWFTNQARLRVNTGAEGDVVTLTSSAFDSAWEAEPTSFTATTDDQGDAYFYGATVDAQGNPSALTYGFLVQLTKMRVAVQQPSDSQGSEASSASEGRSVALDDAKQNVIITLDTPITLLEASDVVPVTLAAETAYKLMAEDKRNTAKTENINSLSVIDGQCGITEVTDGLYVGTDAHVTTVKAQIETAVAMGITEFTVINQLASYSKVNEIYAGSVVGEAIRLFGSNNIDTKITLTLADATVVPELAFIVCEALQSVTAPAATSIGEYAFAFCSGLTSVSLPEVTNIGEQAFAESGLIGGLSLPAATTIGISAFSETGLTSVYLPNATSIGENAFRDTGLTGELSLPAAETIGFGAFSGCIDITEVVADKATMIEKCAFDYCTSLMSVSLPEATTISSFAFRGCTALTTVTLPKVEKIFTSAFQECTSLASVVANSATEIWPSVFSECTGLTSVTFGAVIETIKHNSPGDSPFSDFSTENCDLTLHAAQLNHDTYPVSVSNDGKLMWAGAEWKSITLLDGPNGTAGTKYYIDNGMPTVEVDGTCGITGNNPTGDYSHVSAMTKKIKVVANAASKVIVKNGLATYDGGYSYPYTVVGMVIRTCGAANGSITLVLDETITSVPEDAFYQCNSLLKLSLPAAQKIGKNAFNNCTSLTLVELPAAQEIGNYAFNNCKSLTSVSLPAATSIGNSAFWFCTSLTSVSLPAATSIGEEAFRDCSALTSLTFGSVVQQVGSSVFFNSSTMGCDLFLAAGQLNHATYPVTASGGKLMWADEQWNSITVGGVQYKAVGNELYAVIDGTDSYLNLSTYIQKGNLKFYVVNGLSGITKAFTIAGTGASEGSISLVLDEGITDIPSYAFQDCNALGSVVANGVETIEYGAFSGTLAIEELTFKKVISYNDNDSYKYAFGQQPQDGYYWTFNCTLTLNESQSELYEYDNIPSVIWGSCFWKSITIGGQAFPGDSI